MGGVSGLVEGIERVGNKEGGGGGSWRMWRWDYTISCFRCLRRSCGWKVWSAVWYELSELVSCDESVAVFSRCCSDLLELGLSYGGMIVFRFCVSRLKMCFGVGGGGGLLSI